MTIIIREQIINVRTRYELVGERGIGKGERNKDADRSENLRK